MGKEGFVEKIMGVVLTIGIIAVSLYAIFWLIFRPEWSGNESVVIRDPFSGFVYKLNYEDDYVCVYDIVHTLSARDGCLKIPDSFWGRPVEIISIWGSSSNLSNVHIIEIPDSVHSVSCIRLSGVAEIRGGENVVSISSGAFEQSGYTKVLLGDKICFVGEGAFSECTNLEEVYLGKYIDKIEDKTFYGCSSLKQIQLGYNVTRIGEEAFAGCSSLEKVTQTINLRSIDDNAFEGTPWSKTEEGKAIINAY